jgi:cysteinyl-tRNA synthetase
MSEKVFRLYDTMTKGVKPLTPREPGHLRFYSCGPTVYSYAHIGNFRSFLTADLIVRTARAIGWHVTWVSNITDVGHLTQDDIADSGGEDKMERALKSKEGEQFNNVWELAEYYTSAFMDDWRRLNLVEPDVRPKATQHVREQILAAQDLIRKGHAYETPTGVYFSVESFPEYGELSGNTQEQLLEGVRDVVVDDNKRQQADFAIWKKDDRHLMQWFSPFGWGFPGWHIECSAMARRYLGDTLDLHSGGEDNIFPHHECEIAQSESLTGKPFCGHWVHTRFLQVNGQKMAKSAGNFLTVRNLMERGIDPLAVRFALISVAFTKQLNFTDQSLRDAIGNVERFARADALTAEALEKDNPGEDDLGDLTQLYDQALTAMCDDLNTSVALAKALEGTKAILGQGVSLSAASAQSAKSFLDKINDLLGVVRRDGPAPLGCEGTEAAGPQVNVAHVENLIQERAEAKRAKNFSRADEIRKELEALDIELRDTPDGTTWHQKQRVEL